MTENYTDFQLQECELNDAIRKHSKKKTEKPKSRSLPALKAKVKVSEAAFAAHKTKLLQLAKATRKQANAQVSRALRKHVLPYAVITCIISARLHVSRANPS